LKTGRRFVQGDEIRCRPSTLITAVKTARTDKEISENRQVTIQDVTAKIKKRKWLFVKSCNRRSLTYNAKEFLKLAVSLNRCFKVFGYDGGN
jgi:hypothetical protein